MKQITFNVYLQFKEEFATYKEIQFIKENNDYFHQFNADQLKSILYPYKPVILVNRFEEDKCRKLIQNNSQLIIILDDRSPTLKNNRVITDDLIAKDTFNNYLIEMSKSLNDDFYTIVQINDMNNFCICYFRNNKYLISSDDSDQIFGNGPLILNKYSGKIYKTGSANPEKDIKEFEKLYFPH
ncbi:hypothetical protein EHQ24_06690 [Leptospira noumeaensis]|uniref:Uncharacterized protein n=1 Tax=Leptospira noumeaensis TaxID=2484964 RepID=A0A4R9I9W8_9LEPT|nr:hypothetical protein [Leptospira noumeaensis]TGK83285.1 hypothetical protein EHQ24_06690 [Leptospira noumeaensis]